MFFVRFLNYNERSINDLEYDKRGEMGAEVIKIVIGALNGNGIVARGQTADVDLGVAFFVKEMGSSVTTGS